MKVELTDRDIQLLLECISTNINTIKRRHSDRNSMVAELLNELEDLSVDLLEASAQRLDWDDPEDPDPISIAVCDTEINAETQMFNAGVEAREQLKASSRAAARRDFNLKNPDRKLSATQKHDLWAKPANDPADW
jgi:hypothetical protein